MIVTSLCTGEKYFWVKVPRTATQSYEKIFFPNRERHTTYYPHYHLPFRQSMRYCDTPTTVEKGFTVVRHPWTRFVSALQLMQSKKQSRQNILNHYQRFVKLCEYCEQEVDTDGDLVNHIRDEYHPPTFLENEDVFYDFMYSHFDRNCIPKPYSTLETIFDAHAHFMKSFFITQTFFAYHPKVQVFKFEQLEIFNNWIEVTLGYNTSSIPHSNSSKDGKLSIDVHSEKFHKLVQHLFHDDYKLFGYT